MLSYSVRNIPCTICKVVPGIFHKSLCSDGDDSLERRPELVHICKCVCPQDAMVLDVLQMLVLQSFLRSASSVHDLLKNDARPPHFWRAASLFFGKCCRKVVSSVSSLPFANTDARPMRSSCQEMHQTEHFQAVSCFPTEMLLLHSAGKQWSKPSCASPKKQAENEDTHPQGT